MNFNNRDRLLLLTDGITDICSPSGQRYDMRYIEENIMNNKDKNIEEIKNIVIKDTYNFIYGEKLENNKIYDDITLLLLELYE
jgi:serine phosphatase RsbU (regulator of sigma subunit)